MPFHVAAVDRQTSGGEMLIIFGLGARQSSALVSEIPIDELEHRESLKVRRIHTE